MFEPNLRQGSAIKTQFKSIHFYSTCTNQYIVTTFTLTTATTSNIKINGNIFVAGRKINPVQFRENIAYVMQDDSLLATATPREALEFSAQLR